MKRFLAVLAILGLVVFTASPAKAEPLVEAGTCEDGPLDLLGISLPVKVCATVEGDFVVTTLTTATGSVVELSRVLVQPVQTIVERVEVPVIVPGEPPAPATVTRTAPAPAPRTVTETNTVTEAPATITVTPTPSASPSATPSSENGPAGQDQDESDRLDDDSEPTLATPPTDNNAPGGIFDFDLVPDDPEVAAATFSILGLIAGLLAGGAVLYFVYKSGRDKGEEEFAESFIAPGGPKHRA